MTTAPSVDKVEERLETLPQRLRSAMFSVKVTRDGEKIGLDNGLYDGDIPYLAEVIAWVFLGFLHHTDTAQAIEDYVDVDEDVAQAIAKDLSEKLFKEYEADLEKVFTPMAITSADLTEPAPLPVKPAPMPMPAPLPASQPPTPPQPSAPTPSAAKVPPPAGIPATSWQPTKLSIPAAPPAPAASVAPAPFMIHQESSAAPLATGPDFKLDISRDMFKSGPSKPMEVPRPARAAELEIGRAPVPSKSQANASFRTAPQMQSRTVHYTDLRTAVPGFGAAQPPLRSTTPAPMPAKAMPAAIPPPAAPLPPIGPSPQPPSPMRIPMPIKLNKPPAPPAPLPVSMPTASPQATVPMPPKPPKVVNFGPEEVK